MALSDGSQQNLKIASGLLLASAIAALMSAQEVTTPAIWTAAITCICAVWWMTEALPLAATALVPVAVFPLLGILTPNQVAEAYGNPLILLFLGGFLLSKAMEHSGAHRRLALQLVRLIGGSGRRLAFAFMLASALLSMWVSNTATVLMLLPVALAVVEKAKDRHLVTAILLGLAYGASIGGLGTPIGSPPNLVFMRVYQETTGSALSFLDWMQLGLPVVIVFLPIAGFWLTRRVTSTEQLNLPEVGKWQPAEWRVILIFMLTAAAWITRKDPFGGWSHWLDLPQANDASVALLAALLLFILPNGRGGRLLNWEAAKTLPWGMLILFAGGIAIAKAFVSSGLSTTLGAQLQLLTTLPMLLLVLCTCIGVSFLTEINSNTATAALLMPILAAVALAADLDPMTLMVPAAFSASCAFMLPVATPPNAIVYGSGKLQVSEMIRTGLALNLIGAVIISMMCLLLIK